MPVPDRSDLPAAFVQWVDRQNRELESYVEPGPVLPAASTPQEIVDAAVALDEAIARHRDDGSVAAGLLEEKIRHLIDGAIAREITEPQQPKAMAVRWSDTDLVDERRSDLSSALATFEHLVYGIDRTTPEALASSKRSELNFRKHIAKRMGVELDLTDEEWWQL